MVPKYLADIQKMQIEPDEIIYLIQEMAREHDRRGPGGVSFYTAMAILADRYRDDHERCFCVMERMRCLRTLADDPRMRGWTMQGVEEDCLLTNEAVFRAVARCPLRANSKRTWFDADEFFALVLNETEPEGSA
jgi:hypothetical protein